jgi:hypothetical protein
VSTHASQVAPPASDLLLWEGPPGAGTSETPDDGHPQPLVSSESRARGRPRPNDYASHFQQPLSCKGSAQDPIIREFYLCLSLLACRTRMVRRSTVQHARTRKTAASPSSPPQNAAGRRLLSRSSDCSCILQAHESVASRQRATCLIFAPEESLRRCPNTTNLLLAPPALRTDL